MRAKGNVPLLIREAGRLGIRANASTPDVICEAANASELTGMRARASIPDVILPADRFGIRAVLKVPALILLAFRLGMCDTPMTPDTMALASKVVPPAGTSGVQSESLVSVVGSTPVLSRTEA